MFVTQASVQNRSEISRSSAPRSVTVTRRAVSPAASARGPDERRPHPLLERLSQRELQVLGLLAQGRTNQQIAKRLLVSVSTVKKHVQHLIAKLRVSDRTQAAVRAIELGFRPEE